MPAARVRQRVPVWAILALWVVLVLIHGWHYVISILALPDIPGGYESAWDFQLLMFAFFRLPYWVLGLAAVLFVLARPRRENAA